MNSEVNRLSTFALWPSNAPVESRVLAYCGFFGTNNFLEAECNWCHCRIKDWEYGDQVEERHSRLEPRCPFIVNYENSGNIPICTTSPEVPTGSHNGSSQRSVNYLIESNRLATFKNWPNPNISPESLAKAGFFYLNRSDEVKCAWCKGVIAKWEKHDNAFEEHKRFFPNCVKVQLGPLIEMASDGIRDLGIQQYSPPNKPKFSSLDARLRTYTNWPIANIQQPEALAQAGLYYQDIDDQVRCFHCNIGLRSWQKEDDPWFEHAKWYPQCQFVQLVKGASYVQQVVDISRQTTQPTITALTIDEAMSTAAVRQALEIGIDAGAVRNVTQRRIVETGRGYNTVEDIIKAVFDDRDDAISENENLIDPAILRQLDRVIELYSSEREAARSSPVATTTQAPSSTGQKPERLKKDSESQDVPSKRSSSNVLNETTKTDFSSEGRVSLEEENRKLKDARLCKVCLDEDVGVVFLPCGHLVTCVQCAPGIEQCPMCRTSVKAFVRTFLS